MSWTWPILALLVVVAYFVQVKLWKGKYNKKKLPPGPKGFPLFGSLHLLGKFPYHDLHKLAQKYGPIMHMRLGLIPTIIVSSPEAAQLFLKTYDHVFASRPPFEASKHLSWEQRNMIMAPYGSYWRDIRKLCTLELLSSVKISSFKAMRKEEVGLLIEFIKKAACNRVAVDLSVKIASLNVDMSCRMIFGKKYPDEEFDERGFKFIMQEGMYLSAASNLGDYIPFIAPLDLQGFTKRMKVLAKVFDDFFEKIIDDHILSKDEDGKTRDFVDVMLSFMGSAESEYRIECPNIKAIMLDMLAIGRDPNAWTDPEKFFPERFVGNSIDLKGRDFQLIPFGSGRRGCPGMHLGLIVVKLVVAQLVHCFDWELPNGMLPTELDMTEEFGMTTPRANHLLGIPTYRLQK